MTFTFIIPNTPPLAREESIKGFIQLMLNRLYVGQIRYGIPEKKKRYLDRLYKELRAYEESGNMEHLANLANYAVLESLVPQNRKFHFDPKVKSVTRKDKKEK